MFGRVRQLSCLHVDGIVTSFSAFENLSGIHLQQLGNRFHQRQLSARQQQLLALLLSQKQLLPLALPTVGGGGLGREDEDGAEGHEGHEGDRGWKMEAVDNDFQTNNIGRYAEGLLG